MYKKMISTPLPGTPSMLPNNLTVHKINKISLGVVHSSVVCLNIVGANGSPPQQKQIACKGENYVKKLTIMQTKWCSVSDRALLVAATIQGLQIFEEDGSEMIFEHLIKRTQEKNSTSPFTRGICDALNQFICIGTSTGSILVFDIPRQGNEIKLHDTLTSHRVGITDLCSIMDKMTSCDEDGNITIWQCDVKTTKLNEIRGSGVPCMSVVMSNTFLIAGFSSGHIRMYDLKHAVLKIEICAHARCINSLDIALHGGMLLSVSEDTFVRVWHLPKASSNKIDLAFETSVTDSQLCGGRFFDNSGEMFGVSAYDLPEIVVFKRH